ncbi:MAG: TrkA C-terminal domain-containing protein [Actinomycetaceae bacterium]|nr:transporter [Arcanobacterium sp.]MDD7686398.1 TrkA C-terminal domain-containing protein [Actinomycetaceae bacterium]MDY5272678.1 TrkA C-terminal domain-containing protein [Arcanobacterium sp.]
MSVVFEYLAHYPIFYAFLLVGIGMAFGRIKVKGISLGAAAVLFLAIAIAAWGKACGVEAVLPPVVGTLGLVLFTFAIGNNSGPSFFSNVRKSLGPMAALIGVYIVVAIVALLVGNNVFHMSAAQIAGTFAGATTNTPALAAAGEASGDPAAATVGYSISYLFGVLGMLVAAIAALGHSASDTDKPEQVTHMNLRVDREDLPRLGDLLKLMNNPVEVSRIRRGEQGPIWVATANDVIEKGDLLTALGTEKQLKEFMALVGHKSSHSLRANRKFLDFRRITVSEPKIAGKTIAELDAVLFERFGAICARLRRGDVDMLAAPDLMVEMGDRIRVVGPTAKMKEISHYFGDSSKGLTDINPVTLGVGMALGVLLGECKILLPGGVSFSMGAAAGALIVGLVFGRIGRIGKQVTALPNTTNAVISELGLLLFLAQAGTNAGMQIAAAFTTGEWVGILLLGIILTTVEAAALYFVMRYGFHMGGTKLSGLLAGAQTQPAVLAFANGRTNSDPRVALGYALVYPLAMIGKILVGAVLGSL